MCEAEVGLVKEKLKKYEVIHAGFIINLVHERSFVEKGVIIIHIVNQNIGHSQMKGLQTVNDFSIKKIASKAKANRCTKFIDEWFRSSRARARLIAEKVLVSPKQILIIIHGESLADLELNGGVFVPRTEVKSGRFISDGIILKICGADDYEIKAKFVINSAGIFAPLLAKKLGCQNVPKLPIKGFAKGNYFSLTGKSPFNKLVYPVPDPGGLGVHLTLSMDGQARFGPDVEWIPEINYKVDLNRKNVFSKEISKYWSNYNPDRLTPDYAGIRAKVSTGASTSDFIISSSKDNGIPGLINLFGIESPGLTSSLAIAEEVARKLNINC